MLQHKERNGKNVKFHDSFKKYGYRRSMPELWRMNECAFQRNMPFKTLTPIWPHVNENEKQKS